MDVVSTLRTTGAVRAFTDEPVADTVIHEILDDARFAPSGGNRQPWRVAVVKDPTLRRRLGELMQPVWDGYVARAPLGFTPYNCVATASRPGHAGSERVARRDRGDPRRARRRRRPPRSP